MFNFYSIANIIGSQYIIALSLIEYRKKVGYEKLKQIYRAHRKRACLIISKSTLIFKEASY